MKKLYVFAMLGLLFASSLAMVSATHSLESACQYDLNDDNKVDWADFRIVYDNFRDGTATRAEVYDMYKAVRMYSKTHLIGVC